MPRLTEEEELAAALAASAQDTLFATSGSGSGSESDDSYPSDEDDGFDTQTLEKLTESSAHDTTVVLAAMAGAQKFKCDYTAQMRETKRCDLADKALGDSAAPAVADAIRNCGEPIAGGVIAIDLSDNQLGRVGGGILEEALEDNELLTELNLTGNPLCMTPVLGRLQALLLRNKCRADMMSAVARQEVHETPYRCNLTSRKLGDSDLEVVAEVLAEQRGSQLKWLDFSGNNIGELGAQVLAAIVATSPSLERIDIADNPGKFSAAGCNLALLCAARATEESTAGVVKLAGCGVGDGAAEAVAAALLSPDGAKFKKIDLEYNEISEIGATLLRGALEDNCTLCELKLSGNPFCGSGVHAQINAKVGANADALAQLNAFVEMNAAAISALDIAGTTGATSSTGSSSSAAGGGGSGGGGAQAPSPGQHAARAAMERETAAAAASGLAGSGGSQARAALRPAGGGGGGALTEDEELALALAASMEQ